MTRIAIALVLCLSACTDGATLRPTAVPAASAAELPDGDTPQPGAGAPASDIRPIGAPTAADLAKFTHDIPGSGVLQANITTNLGTIRCDLFSDKAPVAVANFVGLALGLHPWVDPTTRRVVVGQPFYDNVVFHRVVHGFVIQSGDRTGTGRFGPGYKFDDEIVADLNFDRRGRLAMANSGPNTNGSQFFISLGAYAHLNQNNTIFGQCDEAVPLRIGSVEVAPGAAREKSSPTTPVVIQRIRISRKEASQSGN